ncbi:MAG: hypothetical protein J6I72_00245 [Muribaculaceae bacterium]|nr:hypothetical protein [Muribaculaceae bacterium]
MKKLIFSLTSMALLLTMTACGNDEPQDNILYLPATQMVNHTYNTVEDELVGVNYGAIQVYVNVTRMTAQLAYVFGIDGDPVTLQLNDVPVTYDSNNSGYLIQTSAPATAGTHTVNSLRLFIEVRDIQQNLRHYVKATVDGKYEVTGLMSTLFFKDATSIITRESDAQVITETGSFYRFNFLSLTTENRTATMGVSGINMTPFSVGASYAGLDVEPCAQGLHIYHNSGDPLNNSSGANNQLTSLDGIINMRDFSFSVDYTIDGLGTVKATGNMF